MSLRRRITMDKLLMINQVAQNYNITKRTLRYYEEIGLLITVKKNNSNYRYYDNEALNRLEQILLLRDLNFHISEVKEILISEDDKTIEKILMDKLNKFRDDIDKLVSLTKIIASIISIKNDRGIQQVNVYQILKEQIYVHKSIERMFEMSQFVGDLIIIEFGVNIVECANVLIDSIKSLKQDLKSELNKEIPLVRIKDNTDLKDNEYRILIKGITVKQGLLENVQAIEKAGIITDELKQALIHNIQSIIE
jgi:Predicted transcriptional regulators